MVGKRISGETGDKVDLSALAARDIMMSDPIILREEDTLAVALHKMSIGGFKHIPFVAEGRAIPLVSIQDVFSHVCAFHPLGRLILASPRLAASPARLCPGPGATRW